MFFKRKKREYTVFVRIKEDRPATVNTYPFQPTGAKFNSRDEAEKYIAETPDEVSKLGGCEVYVIRTR